MDLRFKIQYYCAIKKFYNCCAGYLCGAEDYYTKTQVGFCNTNGKTYKGFDLHEGEEPYMDNTTYSTYMYRDRAVDLITTYDQQNVCFIH